MRFLTYIYNAATAVVALPSGVEPKIPVPDLAVQVQVFRDNEPVITTPLHKLTTEGLDARRVPYSAEVRLDELRPGAYVLLVTVIDRRGKSSASQRTNFQID